MSYVRVSEIVQRAIDELVEAGASRDVMERAMAGVEFKAVNSIAANSRAQMLLNLKNKTSDLADQFEVSERTIRNWRKTEIDRQFVSATNAA